MKNKFVYIILLLTILGFVFRFVRDIQTLTAENAALTQQNTTLQKSMAELQHVIDEYRQVVTGLTEAIERDRQEVEKVDRGSDIVRYNLTDTERDLIERVVMAESGGECFEGQMLVCQCILNACEIDEIRPAEVIKRYVYAKGRPEPTDSVIEAVSAVFDRGVEVTSEPIVYFYAPGVVKSKFHESQRFCCEVGGHRFFSER
jgi:hypothetical protein